jgi:hypothetical protein
MIGNLIYVAASISYVMQAVGEVEIFQATLKETHVMVVKRIFKYLRGIIYFGLWHTKGNEMILVSYTNENWVGSIDDKRSTSGSAFYLHDFMVS